MAIILCDKCGQSFNEKEDKCPHCGAENEIKHHSKKLNKWFIFAPIIILALLIGLFFLKTGSSDSSDVAETKTELLEFTLQNGSKGYINPQPKVQNRWNVYFNAAIDALKANGASLVEIKDSDIKNLVSISDGRFYVPIEYLEWFNNGHNYISNTDIQSFCQLVNSGNIFASSNQGFLNFYGEIQQNLDYELNKQRTVESLQQEVSEMTHEINYNNSGSAEEIAGYRVRIFMLQRILNEKGINQ